MDAEESDRSGHIEERPAQNGAKASNNKKAAVMVIAVMLIIIIASFGLAFIFTGHNGKYTVVYTNETDVPATVEVFIVIMSEDGTWVTEYPLKTEVQPGETVSCTIDIDFKFGQHKKVEFFGYHVVENGSGSGGVAIITLISGGDVKFSLNEYIEEVRRGGP
jgi:hypothetical protein